MEHPDITLIVPLPSEEQDLSLIAVVEHYCVVDLRLNLQESMLQVGSFIKVKQEGKDVNYSFHAVTRPRNVTAVTDFYYDSAER